MNARALLASPRALALLVALLAAAVYANSIPNGFALDDVGIIERNERVHGVEKVGTALFSPYWPGAPDAEALYRPVTMATYAVDWELWDGDPRGFHAVNVALHAAVSVLVLLLLVRLGASPAAGAFGAALFAVHPVHTEAVANVVGRAELLASLFYLVVCLAWLARGLRAAVRLPILAFGTLLALGSKEIAVTLPFALVLLDAVLEKTPADALRRLRREVPAMVVIGAAAVAYGLIRFSVLGVPVGNDVGAELERLSLVERLATVTRVWPEYVRLLVLPLDLVADYSPGVIHSLERFDVRSALGLLLAGAALLLAGLAWRRARFVSLGVLWFAVTIFPVSNLVVSIGVLLAERTLYLPSVAVAFVGAAAVAALRAEPLRVRRAALAAAAALVLLGAGRTWLRNPVWSSTETVLSDLATHHPDSFRVAWAVGLSLIERGDVERGLDYLGLAVELVPNHHTLLWQVGQKYVIHGRAAEAEPLLRRAIARLPSNPAPYVYLSQSLINQRRHEEAIPVIAAGLRHTDGYAGLYDQLARAFIGLERWDAALAARRRSLQRGELAAAWPMWVELARLYERLGRDAEAADALETARRLAPPAVRPALRSARLSPDSRAS